MIRLAVIFGGKSGEHEVSLMSAVSVLNALDKTKFLPVTVGITKKGDWLLYEGSYDNIEDGSWEQASAPFDIRRLKEIADFVLPILHGPYGEDGTIQGLFEILNVPYGGCGVLASAAAMDKILAKELFCKAGIPTCKYIGLEIEDFEAEKAGALAAAVGGYPCFVKPANMGSSVGVSKAASEEELISAIALAARYDRRIIIEEGLSAREIETAVIGNHVPLAAAVGEIKPSAEFYNYSAKYLDGGSSELIIPADISEEAKIKVKEYAVKAYKTLDCAGFARVDFFMDRNTEEIYINEVNTIPGFTKYSMFPSLWAAAGVPYPYLIERIVDYGYERYNAKNNR